MYVYHIEAGTYCVYYVKWSNVDLYTNRNKHISWCCREMIQTTFEEITQPLSPGSLLQPCLCKLRVDTWVLSSLCCRWLPLLNEHRITCNVVIKTQFSNEKKIKHVTFLWIFVVFTDKLFIIFGPKYITMDF